MDTQAIYILQFSIPVTILGHHRKACHCILKSLAVTLHSAEYQWITVSLESIMQIVSFLETRYLTLIVLTVSASRWKDPCMTSEPKENHRLFQCEPQCGTDCKVYHFTRQGWSLQRAEQVLTEAN